MDVANTNRLPAGAVRTSDGEVVVPATRRADGSLRKPIRIRKGYVPQEEIPKYKTVAQRRREQEAKAGVDAAVEELSMATLSMSEKREAVTIKERARRSGRLDNLVRGEGCQHALKDKGEVPTTVETSGKSTGDDQQQLKRQLTRINKQLEEIAKLEDVDGEVLSRQEKQKIEEKTELQQQRKEIITELNGATVTTSTAGPRPKISISL